MGKYINYKQGFTMKRNFNSHFLKRTFGKNWFYYFPAFIFVSLLLAMLPSIILKDYLEFNIAKFCEEWLKNVLSLSAIFIIVNYFNYQISLNRTKDKLSMLITNYNSIGDAIFREIEKSTFDRTSLINQIDFLENILIKIKSEDEFLYKSDGITELFSCDHLYSNLKNQISTIHIDSNRITELKAEFNRVKNYLNASI